MDFLSNLRSYVGKWAVKSTEKMSKNDIKSVESAKVVPSQYGLSVCFVMKAGGQKFLPISNDCNLEEGDTVDLSTAEIITLGRDGEKDIYRIKAEAE